MMSSHYFAFLCCLAIVIVSSQALSPTKSPECAGLNRAKTSLEKGIGAYTREPINCLVNKACTGLSCNGTHKSDPFYMSVQLKHCKKAGPEIHLDLIYKKYKVNVHRELKDGSTIDLYSIGMAKIKLQLNLKRKQNTISIRLLLENCIKTPLGQTCKDLQTLLPQTTICVNMDACPKGIFNTTGYAPCHLPPTQTSTKKINNHRWTTPKPTGYPSTMHGVHSLTGKSPTPYLRSTQSGSPKVKSTHHSAMFTTIKPKSELHSTLSAGSPKTTHHSTMFTSLKPTSKLHSTHSGSPKTTHHSTMLTTLKPTSKLHSTQSEPLGAKDHIKGDGHHHLSVGEAVGIGFAVVAVILIVLGVIIYWKKFHHRSRLRAAYYNDISMNDPLYEDFGPEVA